MFAAGESFADARPVQAKLRVGAVDDPLEREADRKAEAVLREDAPAKVPAQAKVPQHGDGLMNSPGQPLDNASQDFFGRRFGADFSSVRIHTDSEASDSAHALNARAFTTGNHIAFASGSFAPAEPTGKKLIAHELSHVLQQGAGVAAASVQRAPEDEANSPEQMRLPPKGFNPEAEDLPRTPMEEAKLSWAVSHKVITFILGPPSSDNFYKAAYEYWKQPGRTDVLVTTIRTLTDVLAYLNDPKHAPPNGRSWGQINLVTHANEEGGMGIKLSSDSPNNISPEELEDKIKAGAIPKVDGSVVDFHTDINVHGCAIGRNPEMLKNLSQAISGGQSDVYAPKDLQAYQFSGRGDKEKTEEFLVEYWAVGFPAGEARGRKELVQQFSDMYGDEPGVDWGKAIGKAETKTMPYHFNFKFDNFVRVPAKTDRAGHARLLAHVPDSASWIRWSVADENTVPDGNGNETTTITYDIKTRDETGQAVDGTFEIPVTSPIIPQKKEDQKAWLADQIGQDKVDRFSWNFSLSALPAPGASASVSLVAEGARTVVRIERDLRDKSGAHEHPSREDTKHYGSYKEQ